ncbi:MAG: hypothetical protein RML15_09270, partial [Bacteroidota bacterium]|nr:hypothetical protein [Bacteroidota bacterium]
MNGCGYPIEIAFQSTRPRRARRLISLQPWKQALFQSTRPRRARRLLYHYCTLPFEFQSTRPRRARPQAVTLYARETSFNPRAREGRDSYLLS